MKRVLSFVYCARLLLFSFIALLACSAFVSLAETNTTSEVSISGPITVEQTKGSVHIAMPNGLSFEVPILKDQAEVAMPRLADDGLMVGWLALFPNCCTSYPIPRTLLLYKGGTFIQSISSEMMIWDWDFWNKGQSIVVVDGPTHGSTEGRYRLFDTHNGKLLDHYDGPSDKNAPIWVQENCKKMKTCNIQE